mmetsp:Transcript_58198/g.170178  ORF Transcript_58198/g.170178 Transcript_58198/m.170178 type:complete len:273 (-) Transcript_58198:223-1041(-)
MSAATTYSFSRLCVSMRVASLLLRRSSSSSWPRDSDMRHTPLNGGPPKNLEPVQSTSLPLSKCSRMSFSPTRPWQASTTGTTNLPWVATIRSRQAREGMHLPVLLPTTMCTTMEPYLGTPFSPSSSAARATASSTHWSLACGLSNWPCSSRMKRFTPEKKPELGTSPRPSALKTWAPSGSLPEGNLLAKSWPMEACNVPEPTSPAAVITLQTSEPRPVCDIARVMASSEGMSSASVPEGNRLMLSSHDSPKIERRRSRISQSSFRNKSSGEA